MKDANEKIGKSAIIIFLGTVFGSGLNYLTRILIGQFYGPSDYGLISMGIAALSAAVTISLLGLRQGIARWMSYFSESERKMKGVMSSALKVGVPASLFVSFILFILAERISTFLGEPSLVPIIKIFCLAVPFYAILDIFVAGIRGLQNSRYKVYSYDIAWPGLRVILVTIAVVFGLSLEKVAGFHVVALGASALLSFFIFRKLFPFEKIKKSPFGLKRLLEFSWPLILTGILFMLTQWTDVFMIGYFKSSTEVGIYNTALPTASLLIFVLFSFNYMFMPKTSELFSEDQKEKIRSSYKSVVRWIFLITLPVFTFVVLFSAEILGALFGEVYTAGALSLLILAVGYFYASFVGPTGEILISKGKPKLLLLVFLVITTIDISMNFFLIPVWGITGAAVALTTSFLLGWSLSVLLVKKELGVHPFDSKLLKPLLLILVISLPLVVAKFLLEIEIFHLAALGILLLILYLLGLLKLGVLEEREIELLKVLKENLVSFFESK
ncbi:MAG: flippase [Candidatus Aenigmatarchaeota archaeon]